MAADIAARISTCWLAVQPFAKRPCRPESGRGLGAQPILVNPRSHGLPPYCKAAISRRVSVLLPRSRTLDSS